MTGQTNQEQRPRPDLLAAIHGTYAARQQAAEEAAAPERERQQAEMARDAALFGTPGWSRLSEARRMRAARYSAEQGAA
ncbi:MULTISPECIES: hypothetical protein [unclassified Streptomyces]|uniref:hypothetical protein n=1 Tax=unclassified Streptomyces TaxID=2593676 RepID=UPI0004CB7338|nr:MULTISPECIES: hypothetical protein [unclassified Streptomyces]KJY18388.1 hypothetical protein VR43_25195 [Streptomyces sp. NRRL S-104]